MDVLFVNFVVYIIWALLIYRKYKRINVYFLLVLMISVIAFLGFYTVVSDIYYDTFFIENTTTLLYEPYVYCLIVYFLLFHPLRKLEVNQQSADFLFSKLGRLLIRLLTAYLLLFALLKFYESLSSIGTGLGNAYESRHMDGQRLFFYDNIVLDKFLSGYGTFLYNASYPVLLFYTFVGYRNNKLSGGSTIVSLFVYVLPSFLMGLSEGSRGGLFSSVMCNCFLLVLFWPLLTQRLKRVIFGFSILLVSVIIFFTLLITIQRVGDSDGGSSILRYFGESFPNLGYQFYDQVVFHPMGMRFFPEFLFGDNFPWSSTDDSYTYWESITGVRVIIFKTFYGDLYIEFGTLLTIVLMTLLFLFMSRLLRNKMSVITLPFLFFYLQMCSQSFAGFNKISQASIFQLEIILLFELILYYISRRWIITHQKAPTHGN